jgi:hypothetical protein
VSHHFKLAAGTGLAVLIMFLWSGGGWGAEPPATATVHDAAEESAIETVVQDESLTPREAPETHLVGEASAGYRFFTITNDGGRAAEYEYLHSSPVLSGMVNYLGPANKFALEGSFLNDKDYFGDLSHDYKGLYRFQLRTESLFHNLEHERLFAPDFNLGASYSAVDLNPGERYGVRVGQDLARLRYKLDQYPLHVNLGYWRMAKEGIEQLRFADQAFEGNTNRIYTQTRKIDRQTHEGMVGFDTHLALLDVVYDFRIRQFDDLAGTPRDNFIPRLDPLLFMPRNGGAQEHSETPDSRFYSHTIKLHTTLSGGIVGAASYTYGRRDNMSNLRDLSGASQAHDTLQNVAGDFTYTPCGYFSLALKYRRQEVDRNAPPSLASAFAVDPNVTVRPAIDTQKDSIIATFSFRPVPLLMLKGEYRGVFFSRDHLDSWSSPGRIASLPLAESSDLHSGTFTLTSKPLKGLRFKAQYSYSTVDNALYGNAFEQKHDGSLQISYNSPSRWGATASTRITRELSDRLTITSLDLITPAITLPLPRERSAANATFSLWFVPVPRLTVTGSYGLLRNSTDQAVLFAGLSPASNVLTNFTSQAQIFSVNSVYRFSDRLDLSLALQQVRSFAEFAPAFAVVGPNQDTAGIQEISQSKTVESSLATRVEYHLAKGYSCAVDYSFRDYDEQIQGLFNGTVQTVMAYVSKKW